MKVPGAVRIPFGVAVDCGFEGNCFARNISKTGVYIEVPLSKQSAQVPKGVPIQLLISPFGSSPSAMIQGTISRIEKITLSDGSEGFGFGIQFKNLPEELQSVIQRHIVNYVHDTIPHDDFRELGRSIFEQFLAKSLPSDERFEQVRTHLSQLSAHAKTRINNVLAKRFETSADWLIGQGYMLEIGLYTLLSIAQHGENAEKENALSRIRIQVASFQDELSLSSNALGVDEHTARKELTDMTSRLSGAVKKAKSTLMSASELASTSTPTNPAQDDYTGIFFDLDFFELYLGGKTKADILNDAAKNLISAISQDWDKYVQERPGLSESAAALLKQIRLLAIKIAFETRQLIKTKPLAKSLSSIVPNVKPTALKFMDLAKQAKALLDASPADAKKDPLAAVQRGMKYLTILVTELQKFVTTLPVTPELATTYYKEFQLRPIVYDSKQATESRRAGKSVSLPKSVQYTAFAVAVVVFVILHSNFLWGLFYQLVPTGLGHELGVIRFTVNDDTFDGVVSEGAWNTLSKLEKQQMGDKFARKLVGKGIPRVILHDQHGLLVAKTMNVEGRRKWIVSSSQMEVAPKPVESTPATVPAVAATPGPSSAP